MDEYVALTEAREYMASNFGFAAAIIESDPELKAVFQEALDSGEWDDETNRWITPPWTADQFRARIKLTKSYRRGFPSYPFPLPPEPRLSWWQRLWRR